VKIKFGFGFGVIQKPKIVHFYTFSCLHLRFVESRNRIRFGISFYFSASTFVSAFYDVKSSKSISESVSVSASEFSRVLPQLPIVLLLLLNFVGIASDSSDFKS